MENGHVPDNDTAADISSLALKLTEAAQKAARENPQAINRIVDRAIAGVGARYSVQRLLPIQLAGTVAALIARAVRIDPDYHPPDFNAWYRVEVTAGGAGGKGTQSEQRASAVAQRLVTLLNQPTFPEIESAHVLELGPPPVNALGNPKSGSQGYLDNAPNGIGARAAWNYPGGDGAGVRFVDMEADWDLSHEDLVGANIGWITDPADGMNVDPTKAQYAQDAKDHGTSVLGIVLMVDNGIGGVGIAPAAKGMVARECKSAPFTHRVVQCRAESIIKAANAMTYGDVLLLESQTATDLLPVETENDTYDAIRLATALGIVVVEAGGNGSRSLDDYVDASTPPAYILNRSRPEFRDSGAIMVGGSTSAAPHSAAIPDLSGSGTHPFNYGSRIDLFAWGENVFTTASDGNPLHKYTTDDNKPFNGSSSASAIVAGAAVVLQGLAGKHIPTPAGQPPYRFSPGEVRQLLKTGATQSADPANDKIGVMPNLAAIISSVWLNLPADVYLRGSLDDTGARPSTAPSQTSPDIIIRQAPVANPQATLGDGNNAGLSQPLQPGKSHSIYVRLFNRGGSPATNVSVDLYWALPATLTTPNTWRKIGTVPIPAIPAGTSSPIVSPEFPWPWPADLAGTENVTLAAIATSPSDPAPPLPNFAANPPPPSAGTAVDPAAVAAARFAAFLERNNNVAVRSVQTVTHPPPSHPPFSTPSSPHRPPPHTFPFHVPAHPYAPRRFALEAVGDLALGATASLRVPLELARLLRAKMGYWSGAGDVVEIPLPVRARYRIGAGVLQAGALEKCELVVDVPEEGYGLGGGFVVRQLELDEGGEREVGRLTWVFREAEVEGSGNDGSGGPPK